MIKIIIVAIFILCIIHGIKIFTDYCYSDIFDYVCGLIMGLFMGAIINMLFILILGSLVNVFADKKEIIDYNVNIQAIEDNQSVSGRFFLGSGNIDGNIYYYYMINEQGKTQIKRIKNDDNVYIIQQDTQKPKITFYKTVYTNKHFKDIPCIDEDKIEIYIPKGTVKTNYNIDMK